MASTHKHIRSSTANKRPTTAIADGQIALNTNASSPGLFFKDSTGASIIKIGPVHVGSTAPNATPGAGGSSGNSTGEIWLDNSLTPVGVKIWNGSAWVNATPVGSTTVQGLLELATSAETQAGSDTDRAVTPAGLQSKVSDSTSTTSSTTIASSTAVKSAYDLANAALPKAGGTITGNLEIGTTGSLSFEGSTADAFETTIAVTDPTADRTITLPDTTGTIVTTGDTGTVTSTMIADGTIVNADVNASAAIAHSKLASITAGQVLLGNASNVPTSTALSGDVTVNSSGVTAISTGVIVNADVNASAAIAGTKISPDFGSQTIATTGIVSHALGTAAAPTLTFTGDTNTGIYSPGTDQVAISTNGQGRLFVDANGNVGVGTSSPGYLLDTQTSISTVGATSSVVNFTNTYNNFDVNPTTAYTNLRLQRLGKSGSSYPSQADFAISRYEDVSSNARTQLDIKLAHVGSGGFPENTIMSLRSDGKVGVGTSSPGGQLEVFLTSTTNPSLRLRYNSTSYYGDHLMDGNGNYIIYAPAANGVTSGNLKLRAGGSFSISTNDQPATSAQLTVDTSGRLGVGTTSPTEALNVARLDSDLIARFGSLTTNAGAWIRLQGKDATGTSNQYWDIRNNVDGSLSCNGNTSTFSERARIDSSGRLLVGTASARDKFFNTSNHQTLLQVERVGLSGTQSYQAASFITNSADGVGAYVTIGASRGTTVNSYTALQSGDIVGKVAFQGADGTELVSAAEITAFVDGTPGANDMPGRLVFSTTADGASSPTERMRIGNNGDVLINTTSPGEAFFDGTIRVEDSTTVSAFRCTGTAGALVQSLWHQATTGDNQFVSFGTEVTRLTRGSITYNRTSGVVAYNTTSDYRAKTILGDIDNPGETIDALKVYRGVMNDATVERPMLIAASFITPR